MQYAKYEVSLANEYIITTMIAMRCHPRQRNQWNAISYINLFEGVEASDSSSGLNEGLDCIMNKKDVEPY